MRLFLTLTLITTVFFSCDSSPVGNQERSAEASNQCVKEYSKNGSEICYPQLEGMEEFLSEALQLDLKTDLPISSYPETSSALYVSSSELDAINSSRRVEKRFIAFNDASEEGLVNKDHFGQFVDYLESEVKNEEFFQANFGNRATYNYSFSDNDYSYSINYFSRIGTTEYGISDTRTITRSIVLVNGNMIVLDDIMPFDSREEEVRGQTRRLIEAVVAANG